MSLKGLICRKYKRMSLVLQDGRMLPFDMIFLALGVQPSPLFKDSGI